MKVFNYFDTAVVFVIPFTAIVILNTYTALAVWKVAGVRRTMTIHTRQEWNRRKFFKVSILHVNLSISLENQISRQWDQILIFTLYWILRMWTTWTHTPVRIVRKVWFKFKQIINLTGFNFPAPRRAANSSQIKVTKMLLIVSTVFVCLNLPSYIMRIKAFHVEVFDNFLNWDNFRTKYLEFNFAEWWESHTIHSYDAVLLLVFILY